jgi:hypothetical protein
MCTFRPGNTRHVMRCDATQIAEKHYSRLLTGKDQGKLLTLEPISVASWKLCRQLQLLCRQLLTSLWLQVVAGAAGDVRLFPFIRMRSNREHCDMCSWGQVTRVSYV